MHPLFAAPGGSAQPIPISFVTAASYAATCARLSPAARAFAQSVGFEAKPGRHLLLPGADGGLGGVLFALEPEDEGENPFLPGQLAAVLPPGVYRFANAPDDPRLASLAIALGTYRFDRYRKANGKQIRLALTDDVDATELSRIVDGVFLARDLINTPANDLGPAEFDQAVRALAARHAAQVRSVVGEELARQFPLVHAVGRAASRPPRLVDMTWGDGGHPKVTLVGKGVCFDTGGLDIKPSSGMLLMKKDMGGAACVLALAHMIMDAGLKLRLRVLIPAVENAISGDAFRPLDVYRSRKGLTVEIGNTDAEGRLILADALAAADEEAPELLIDMATLTGAARIALGPDLPAFYTDDDSLADALLRDAKSEHDPLWRMPLWRPYDPTLDSKVADVSSVSSSTLGGSITAALFLSRFVAAAKSWIHLDVFAWNPAAKPARPEGGECQAARAIYALLKDRYG
jgi:leucyl aminopeptidase